MSHPTYLAPLLEAFFTERLMRQREASANTVESYSTAFKLLLAFAHQQLKKTPSKLRLEDLDAPSSADFSTTWNPIVATSRAPAMSASRPFTPSSTTSLFASLATAR